VPGMDVDGERGGAGVARAGGVGQQCACDGAQRGRHVEEVPVAPLHRALPRRRGTARARRRSAGAAAA